MLVILLLNPAWITNIYAVQGAKVWSGFAHSCSRYTLKVLPHLEPGVLVTTAHSRKGQAARNVLDPAETKSTYLVIQNYADVNG